MSGMWWTTEECQIVTNNECIGPDFVRTFVPMWSVVQYAWRASLRVLAVHLWDMFFGGHRWDRVAMDILDMSVPTEKGNRYVLVIVDCFSRWTEACPLPNKMVWLSSGVRDSLQLAYDEVLCHAGQVVQRQKCLYDIYWRCVKHSSEMTR